MRPKGQFSVSAVFKASVRGAIFEGIDFSKSSFYSRGNGNPRVCIVSPVKRERLSSQATSILLGQFDLY